MKMIVFLLHKYQRKNSSHQKTMLYANVKSVTKTERIGERKPECKLNEANYLLY